MWSLFVDELKKYITLVDEVRKLPEIGDPIIREAMYLQNDAKRVIAEIIKLEAGFDDLVCEIQELWTQEERRGSIF